MLGEENYVTSATDDIVISACFKELSEDEKDRENRDKFVFGYYLCIENNSSETIQLVGKHWNITDAKGNSFCDDSFGFKGEIPTLEPGEYYEFSSVAPISTPSAVFYGSCKVVKESRGVMEDVRVPTFLLGAVPEEISRAMN